MNAKRASIFHNLGAILAVALLCLAGAGLWYLLQPRQTSRLTLSQVGFDILPGWSSSADRAALAAFRRSCSRILAFQPEHPMGGAAYAGTARDWQDVCTAADAVSAGETARIWFETFFVPFAAGADGSRAARFTGYYEPEIHASRNRHDRYASPIFGLPSDLVVADLGLFRRNLAGIRLEGRVDNHQLLPFPSRAAIDKEGLTDAPILLYADDPIAVFFLHIQGSGRATLDDGTALRLAYAGQNGRAYTPIGRTLIEQGAIDRHHLSMQAIRSWLETHPGAARSIMETDDSYVFFRELPIGNAGLGSPGTEGVPLTPETSIAVDPAFHAQGVPMFVTADQTFADSTPPTHFARLCIAQDTGGAIKGSVRADIFWGFGAHAEAMAGRMNATGRLYVLLPKPLAARLSAQFRETS